MSLAIAPDFAPEEHFGPSRLKKARQCPTAEALHYVVGLREPRLTWEDVCAIQKPVAPPEPPKGTVLTGGAKMAHEAAKRAYKKALKAYNKIRRPALGTAGHAKVESYYKGEPVDWHDAPGRIILAGLHYLPIPKQCQIVEPEEKITVDLSWLYPEFPELRTDRLVLQGTRDLAALVTADAWTEGGCRPPGFVQGVYRWILIDHKTTLTFDFFDREQTLKTVKTPEELAGDEQVNLYGLQVMQDHGLEELSCRWVYYRTEGSETARAVDLVITLQGARAVVRQQVIEALALRAMHRQKLPIESYEKRFDACDNYGGCIYDKRNGGPCPGSAAEPTGLKLIRLSRKAKHGQQLKSERAALPPQPRKARTKPMAFANAAAKAGVTKPVIAAAPPSAAAQEPSGNEGETQSEETRAAAPTPAPAAPAKPKATRAKGQAFEGVTGSYNGVLLDLPPGSPLAAAIVKAVEAKQALDAALNGE